MAPNFTPENRGSVLNQVGTQTVHGNIVYMGGDVDDQCLCDLKSTVPRDDKTRIEQTKDKPFKESFMWILDDADFKDCCDNDDTQLLWKKGDPGKGKTMLMIGLIEELSKQLESEPESGILSYFFCQGTEERLKSAVSVLRGLIYLLASQKRNLIRNIRKRYDVSSRPLFEDCNALYALSTMLLDMLDDDSSPIRVYLMVDALDECRSEQSQLLKLIVHSSSRSSSAKWLVSSRNMPDIEERLRTANSRARISLELNALHISRAVKVFIDFKVSELRKMKTYQDGMCEKVRSFLYEKADGTFLSVALVCKTLETARIGNTLSVLEKFPPGLQPPYERMMKQISSRGNSENVESCTQILSSLPLARRPINLKELVSVAGVDENLEDLDELNVLIELNGCFLTVQEGTVYFIHQSAKDYFATGKGSQILP